MKIWFTSISAATTTRVTPSAMDNKLPDCFGTDPRARDLRIELAAQHSMIFAYEHFMWSELKSEPEHDVLRIMFVSHEIRVTGAILRRIEPLLQSRDLAWLRARSDRYRVPANDEAYIAAIEVRPLQEGGDPTVTKTTP